MPNHKIVEIKVANSLDIADTFPIVIAYITVLTENGTYPYAHIMILAINPIELVVVVVQDITFKTPAISFYQVSLFIYHCISDTSCVLSVLYMENINSLFQQSHMHFPQCRTSS